MRFFSYAKQADQSLRVGRQEVIGILREHLPQCRADVHGSWNASSRRACPGKDTGALGLRSIVDEAMLDVMFDLPDRGLGHKYVVTPEAVNGNEQLLPMPTGAEAKTKSA